jgi:hypothetical protein
MKARLFIATNIVKVGLYYYYVHELFSLCGLPALHNA